jgi:hypothetical protein
MPAYATITELMQQMNWPETDHSKDTPMQLCLDAASAVLDRICNRPDGFLAQAPSARTYLGTDKDYIFIDECAAVTLVETRSSSSSAWTTVTGWFPFAGDPKTPVSRGPYSGVIRESGVFMTYRFMSVQITAKWGYALTVPDQVKQATIMQAARWYKRGESAWADATASGEMGQLLYRKAFDPDIENIVKNGRLIRPAAG